MAEGRTSPFGEQLRRLREAAGITQEELAERAGLSRDAVSALERGLRRRPHPQTVRALSVGLGLSDRELGAFRAAVPKRGAGSPPPSSEARSASLPIPPTCLVGRQRELAELRRRFTSGEARLVTLTGPGGVGKTRLALELAAELEPAFSGGVVFVPLAAVHEPSLVLPAITEALGVRETSGRSLATQAARVLRDQRLLLVLDNFEHVVEGASPVAALLAACPGLAVLATSRATLRLSGEHEYPVPPLSLPPVRREDGSLPVYPPTRLPVYLDSEAVALFVQRARAAKPDFTLTEANAAAIAEICRRLDGLPLAIELAAARVKVLSPESLLVRLESGLRVLTGGPQDQPARLRSLRDAVAWSYDLLPPDEQALFRRLAVFAGGCTLEAAEWVMGDGSRVMGIDDTPSSGTRHPSPAVLDGVASLVDKSLLRRLEGEGDEPRFGMLATIREYGLERLAAAGDHTEGVPGEEEATRRAHAAYFLGLAEQAWPAFRRRAGQEPWMNRLEAERGNLRAALRWLDESGDAESLLRLTGALYWFWYVRGPLSEGRAWLERALAAPGTEAPSVPRVRALLGVALLAHFRDDDDRALTALEASLALCSELDDPWWLAYTLLALGIVAEDRGEYHLAEARFVEALPRFLAADDRANAALMLLHLGIAAWGQGDVQRAAALCEEAVGRQREEGDVWGLATSLAYLGLMAAERGDHVRAAALHRESLGLRWKTGAWEDVAGSLADLAVLAAAVERAEQAARLFGTAAALREEAGRVLKLPERAAYERAEAGVRTALGADAFAAARAAGRALSHEQAVAEATALAEEIARTGAEQRSGRSGTEVEEPPTVHLAGLTNREVEVLRLVAAGLTDAEVAERLSVSLRTVGAHLHRIYGKLDVTTRAAATRVAHDSGLV